jgi:Zn-dependent M32 family carboxypeptidase
MWSAGVLENSKAKNNIELAVEYYKKAAEADGLTYQPYNSIVKIYNPELDNPPQEELFNLLQRGLERVRYKSKIYFALAELYGKLNNLPLKQKYTMLAHMAQKNEKQQP